MSDLRRKNLASVLVNYCVAVQPGQWVVIMGNPIAEPLLNDVMEEVLKAGGNPTLQMDTSQISETILRNASDDQLKWVSPLFRLEASEASALISINATENTRSMTNIPPERLRIQRTAQQEVMGIFLQRAAKGELNWVGTQDPCHAYAQEADMSLREYEDFVYRATFADQDDPVKEWLKIHDEQQLFVDWLEGKDKVVVKSPFVDLQLSIKDRLWENSDGKRNMPSGEIFTGPVEDSVNGWIEFTYPAITAGREVEGIRLEFKDGKVVGASAKKNEDYLLKMLDIDDGARYLGEFAIGTNYGIDRFTKSILFDEKIGGTIHLAIGRGYPQTGSKNVSSIHWDMICDMHQNSEITVDGELFYKDGQFQV